MKRPYENRREYIIGYHTQEHRKNSEFLKEPIACENKNAWLGKGYYFWTELEFAIYWGEDSKTKNTEFYDIYRASLNCENCINAVFDEKGYFFLRERIEETIEHFKSHGLVATLDQVNRFLADNFWLKMKVAGIIFDDKPTNPRKSDRIYSEIPGLYYKKRIQIVLYSLENIHNFGLLCEKQSPH